MRFLLLLISSLLIATCAQAQTRGHDASLSTAAPASQDERLDQLFSRLKHERNEQAARLIAVQIGEAWAESGSANADLLMKWAGDAMKAKKYAVALDFLDQVVTLFPDYAEGWNRRATLHFMMDDYAKSMADIAETLKREPRHFGALSGMAGILESTGHEEEALEAYRRVLEIYPMMRSAQAEVTKLSDELTGEGI
jgi:tetratricopeptide (TPR) repeat protein